MRPEKGGLQISASLIPHSCDQGKNNSMLKFYNTQVKVATIKEMKDINSSEHTRK